MNRQDAFRIAIEAEIRSQKLYKALSNSFKNSETAQFFKQLLHYEEDHEAKLRRLFAQEFPKQELVLTDDPDIELKGLRLVDPKAVLEFAISREELAQVIYIKLAQQSEDEETKALLEQLATEEANHKELLFTEIQKLQGILQWYDPSELNGLMEH